MNVPLGDTAEVSVDKRPGAEVEAVVNDDGDLVVPCSALAGLRLVPGQRVRVGVPRPSRRGSAYGLLAGKVTPITREEIKESSREAWGAWIDD